MATFEFLKQIDNLLYYSYSSEGSGNSGQVSISLDGEIWNIEELAEDDFNGYYASHVLSYISEKLKLDRNIPMQGKVVWY